MDGETSPERVPLSRKQAKCGLPSRKDKKHIKELLTLQQE